MLDPKELSACALDRFEASNDRLDAEVNAGQRRQAAMQEAIAPLIRREIGGTVFNLGDLVETAKGAKFWGEIIAFDHDDSLPGCTVLAVDPGFAGTKHVYPLTQLRKRTAEDLHPASNDARQDHFDQIVAIARSAAAAAASKFPQPNYVALKIAEEAGEVVRGGVHYAEGRMEWSEVEAEIVQLLAMLIRFVTEGDQVNGIIPPHVAARLREAVDG